MYLRLISGVICCLLFSSSAMADADDPILFGQETAKISVGTFITDIGSKLRIDAGQDRQNEIISPGEQVGFGSSEFSFRVDGFVRPWERHRFTFGYYRITRRGSAVLENEVEWNDSIFPVGVDVEAGLNWTVAPFSYAYSFVKNEDWEVAASLGVHFLKVGANISGQAFVDGDVVLTLDNQQSKVNGPFPVIGLHIDHQLARNWQVGLSGQWLDLSVGDYNGRLYDIRVFIEYYVLKNVGIGLAFNRLDFNAGVDSDTWTGSVDYAYSGLYAYVTGRF